MARYLQSQGFEAAALLGGYTAWKAYQSNTQQSTPITLVDHPGTSTKAGTSPLPADS